MNKVDILDRINAGETAEDIKKELEKKYREELNNINEVQKDLKEAEEREFNDDLTKISELMYDYIEKRFPNVVHSKDANTKEDIIKNFLYSNKKLLNNKNSVKFLIVKPDKMSSTINNLVDDMLKGLFF